MNKKSRKIIIISILLMIPFLLGFEGFKTTRVELINADKPFVDLDVILQDGGSYLPNEALLEELGEDQDLLISSEDDARSVLNLRVSGSNIYVNGSISNENTFESFFSKSYKGSGKVMIEDDYARYNTFMYVLGYLKRNSIPYTITFK